MKTRGRRRLDVALLTAGAVALSGSTAIGAAIGNGEQVVGMWVSTEIQRDGSAEVAEIIDYDFGAGATDRHGIFRDVPGLAQTAPVQVDSPTAPDRVALEFGPGGSTRIRIGDPNTTIDGRHRYVIGYSLPGVAPRGRLDYNAVGDRWEVDLHEIEVHVRAPWAFEAVRCHQGSSGATGGCNADQVEPGHLVVMADQLSSGEGITLQATAGEPLPSPPPPPVPPMGITPDDGAGLALPAGAAGAAALLATVPVSRLVRRAGRDQAAAGATGAAEVAFSSGGTPEAPTVALDEDDLHDLATIDFAPPKGVTPAHGGILLSEQVRNEHKVAWLLEQAFSGAVQLEGDEKTPTLALGDGGADPILAEAFAGRTEIDLSEYDATFSSAWSELDADLDTWMEESDLWTEEGSRARTRALAWGIPMALLGALGAFAAAWLSGRHGTALLPLIIGAGAVAGAGLALAVRSWELRVRSVKGTGLWLQLESFRRFLAASEAQHADWAAEHGILREYTSWAVALGEIDRWAIAVKGSSVAAATDMTAVHLATAAPRLGAVTQSASTAPSSSGGGGGGGGVGGGAGGGGGGSW